MLLSELRQWIRACSKVPQQYDGILWRISPGDRDGREGMVLDDVCDRWGTVQGILGEQRWERGDGAG